MTARLRVSHYGDTALQPLVLLHGWGVNADIWRDWAESLAKDFHVICVDLPGLGRSPLPQGDYSLSTLAETIVSQLQENPDLNHGDVNTSRPAIWLGWSLGGLVAAQVAKDFSSMVKGLITIATNPCFVAQTTWPLGMDATTFAQFEASLQKNAEKTLQRFASLMVKGDPQAREQLRMLKALLAETEVTADSSQRGLALALSLLRYDARSLFFDMSCPHEYWFAEDDALVDAAVLETAELAAQGWLINDAGHLPFMSQQAQCTNRLKAFSNRLEATHG